ncbi:hypothetical protein [Methylophaga sulfidovorans]|uniref:DUF2157 domain-containing protein n=1 Tax=Methylophaga sulfidovorans TaxID=45496 RepID=A0A1I3W4X4_9GAMM|nr:hypothetical protein [Methylophaga sulfidovorans]SFK02490.1 hypothetical protein SAMN04488079_10433 [Methylophaga sulfidovorans]
MYTDDDLQQAVDKGIFTASSVEQFRHDALQRRNTHFADEEDFKLVSSFNDIFVLMACALLLLSTGWVLQATSAPLAAAVVAIISWGLAEFFVLKRKMALPGIFLLVSFVGGIFAAVVLALGLPSENGFMLAGSVAAVAAWCHWKRFKVPITVAAGTASAVVFIVSLLISLFPILKNYLSWLMFCGGLIVFIVAMKWDSADLKRVTGKSDVAFWLHLTAAPLIVHPIFSTLGIFDGQQSNSTLALIMGLYILLTFVSLVIDRRAFMVSALIYVLVALTELLKTYGLAGDSFAYVGVFIGFSLLLLSGFWHKVRYQLVMRLPASWQTKVPVIQ